MAHGGEANLLVQGLWWLLPFALLMLVMLHAMMEYTVSLLAQRPRPGRTPVTAAELRRRLLKSAGAEPPLPLVEGTDCDLTAHWESGRVSHTSRWLWSAAGSAGRLRVLLDERRHEVRVNQVSRSYYFVVGLRGWLPRLGASAGVDSGPPGLPLAAEVGRVANRGGWSLRPVLWWFEATHRGARVLEALTPPALRQWPARRLWGVLYPLSYLLGVGYLVISIGSLDRRDWYLLWGVSLAWWGAWGFLAWMLLGFPPFWHRGVRRG